MEIRWTEEAANDFERIADYLFERAPDRAQDLVRGEVIFIARILHGAQQWP